MYKILMIDDDEALMEVTRDMLESYEYQVTLVCSAKEGFDVLAKRAFDLIILDINLPDDTGFLVCKEIRKVSNVPIIFASARTSEDDKITGLDIGADDYMAKPYSLRELLSRVNAHIRRNYGGKGQVFTIGKNKDIVIDTASRTVRKAGTDVKLSLKEFDLLKYLCEHKNCSLPKEQILSQVWGAFSEVELSTVAVHIRWLREKLEDNPAKPELIKTVWGVGYCLED